MKRDTLINLLRQNDPAGAVDDLDCYAIESHVMQRLARPTVMEQVGRVMDQILPTFQFGGWRMPWPVVSASAMVCGLALGVMIAAVVEAPAPTNVTRNYVLSEAVPQPWESY